METIKLSHEWHIVSQLAAGGFGKIHAAKSEAGDNVVVKLIPKMPGGDRELLFENLTGTPNVLPVLETGEWDDFWVIIMPRADESLREHFNKYGRPLPADEVIRIIIDITTALAALQDKAVHRDLKPENVLLWQDHWCLADFGIARYAEATTSTETWKYAKTWAYAAPEQWRGERATSATDIYATGIIAYELITGQRPFKGPQEHDYRDQHLHQDPASLKGYPTLLAALVIECLYKAPGARPTAQNILVRLQRFHTPSSISAKRLQQVSQTVTEERAHREALASIGKSDAERRAALASDAEQSLNQILGTLKDRISSLVPQATLDERSPSVWRFKLDEVEFGTYEFRQASTSALDSPGFPAPFQVIGFSGIYVGIPTDEYSYEGRSHALWYCDAAVAGVYRWFETAFMCQVFSGRRGKKDPFSLDPGTEAGKALAPIMGTEFQIAWPFTPIDQGDEEEFYERWMGWFADAAEGKLRHPRHMPERDPKDSWRK